MLKKTITAAAIVVLLVSGLVLCGCGEISVLHKFEVSDTKFDKGSYSDSIFTKYYGVVEFTLKNISDEPLSVTVKVKFTVTKNGETSYTTKTTQETFTPGESKTVKINLSGLINTPVTGYTYDIIKR